VIGDDAGSRARVKEPTPPAAPAAPTVTSVPLLKVEGLRTFFSTPNGTVRAVDGVSFHVHQGDVLGLVGETGSGKSMTAASIMGLVVPPGRIVEGRVLFRGDDLVDMQPDQLNKLRGTKVSLIPQNARASLNPVLPVGKQMKNIWAAHLGLKGEQATAYTLEMLSAVGFDDPPRVARSYPHQLSGGMAQRVVIAMAIGPSPDLVIADEPTTGLDATIQLEILNLMLRMLRRVHAAALLITHDLGVVAHYCTRVAVMHAGEIVEEAEVATFFARPHHPYSAALVNSLSPSADRPSMLRATGDPPDLTSLPSGCKYRWRCPLAVQRCAAEPPELRAVEGGHLARCHRAEDVVRINGHADS
jgi:oligopeptide/dipeptide ABC transporter ATP-binding protein